MQITTKSEQENNIRFYRTYIVLGSLKDKGEERGSDEKEVGEFQQTKLSSSSPGGKNCPEPMTVESNTDAQTVHVLVTREVTKRHRGSRVTGRRFGRGTSKVERAQMLK